MMTREEYREFVLDTMIAHRWCADMSAAADEIADHYATMVDLPIEYPTVTVLPSGTEVTVAYSADGVRVSYPAKPQADIARTNADIIRANAARLASELAAERERATWHHAANKPMPY